MNTKKKSDGWEDVTSWRQSSTAEERETPRSWELRMADIRISVSRHIHYPADTWIMSVHGLVESGIRILESKDIDEAKAEALQYIHDELSTIVAAIETRH